MKKQTLFIGAVIVLGLAFVLGMSFYKKQTSQQSTQTVSQNQEALVRFHSPTLGKASAPVHIVEFFDPACESCRAMYPVVKDLMATHGDKVKLTIRYAPFHQGADDVVRVLEAARLQGKYWETLEALLAAQPQWTAGHAVRLDLVWDHIGNLGLDLDRVREDMKLPAMTELIRQDLEDVKTLKVSGTPEFFVNGKPLPAFGPEPLKAMVDDEVRKAAAK